MIHSFFLLLKYSPIRLPMPRAVVKCKRASLLFTEQEQLHKVTNLRPFELATSCKVPDFLKIAIGIHTLSGISVQKSKNTPALKNLKLDSFLKEWNTPRNGSTRTPLNPNVFLNLVRTCCMKSWTVCCMKEHHGIFILVLISQNSVYLSVIYICIDFGEI